MASAQVLGVIDVSRGGKPMDLQKGSTIELPGWEQVAVNVNGKTLWSRVWMDGVVSVTTVLKRGQTLSQFLPNGEEELQVKCDTGQKFDIPAAFLKKRPKAAGDGEGGKIALEWGFGDFVESVA